ncbi:hypothetical protein [Oceanobacillus oncorhynchi]|uniref:hypothetical protein n=1 Tax=Oceanobacillus oncorhynchi TaxID=545501 RepID=UPI0034D6E9A2
MVIPKYIIDSIEKSSKSFAVARKHEKIVRDWLDKKGLENDGTHDAWIDNIEIGHEGHGSFIDYLGKI